jgi:hypothetical protein
LEPSHRIPPKPGSWCAASKLIFARIWPGCRWCPNDDAVILNDAPILKDSQIAFLHEAFEKAF